MSIVSHVLHKRFIIASSNNQLTWDILSNFTMCQQKTKDLTSWWSWVGRWLREYRLIDRCQSTWKRHRWWAYRADAWYILKWISRSPFFLLLFYSERYIKVWWLVDLLQSSRPSTPPPVIESIRWLYCADWWEGRVLLKISGSMKSTAVADLSLNRKLCRHRLLLMGRKFIHQTRSSHLRPCTTK